MDQSAINTAVLRRVYPFYPIAPVLASPTPGGGGGGGGGTGDANVYILSATVNASSDVSIPLESNPTQSSWTLPANGIHAIEVDCLAYCSTDNSYIRKKVYAIVKNISSVASVTHKNSVDYYSSGTSLADSDFYISVSGGTYSLNYKNSNSNSMDVKARLYYLELGA